MLAVDGWAVTFGTARRPLLAVPNVTTHPSTASVPITVLLYNACASTTLKSIDYNVAMTFILNNGPLLCSPKAQARATIKYTTVNSGLLTLRLWWSGLPDARRSATAHFPCTRLEQPPTSC